MLLSELFLLQLVYTGGVSAVCSSLSLSDRENTLKFEQMWLSIKAAKVLIDIIIYFLTFHTYDLSDCLSDSCQNTAGLHSVLSLNTTFVDTWRRAEADAAALVFWFNLDVCEDIV